jgi:FkbH-like protein
MDPRILDQTKLLIWDLDGTFWDGVLSEEGASFRRDMFERVVASSRHGIISSIASNNDAGDVRRYLREHRAHGYFVFPNVHWGPKPEMVRSILASAQLRPQDAVFLDDKARIRESVRTAVPGLLATATADEFAGAFEAWSKRRAFSDAKLERLKRYQLLERKQKAFRAAPRTGKPAEESAREFLRKSAIRCTVLPVSGELEARVLELIARTNQLNFTRKRIGASKLRALLEDPRHECRALKVVDRFGDYGVCGFYALEREPRPRLRHFLFSCRTLGMGVEEALYTRLGAPELDVHRDQRALFQRLKTVAPADWVRFEYPRERDRETKAAASAARARLTLVGPCEMQALVDVLPARTRQAFAVDSRVTFVDDAGRHIAHFGHHALLELAMNPALVRRHERTLAKIPWFDRSLVDLGFLERREPELLVISAVRSAQCADYMHRSGEFSVPLEYFRLRGRDVTDRENWPWLEALLTMQGGFPKGFARWFASEFECAGPVSEARYRAILERLLERLPPESRLVLVNVADVDDVEIAAPDKNGQRLVSAWKRQHRRVNDAIEDVARAHSDRVAVLDLNRHLRGPGDFVPQPVPPMAEGEWALKSFNDFYHYQRKVTVALGRELANVLRRHSAKSAVPRTKVLDRSGFKQLMVKFLRLLDRPGGEAHALGLLGELREKGRLPVSSDPLRRPTIFYPGLTSEPVWDARQFPWFAQLKRAVLRIRGEYQKLRKARDAFRIIFPGEKEEGDWAAAWLWLYGREIEENIERCPWTMSALSSVTRAGWGGFSVMRPGSHVEPHCGSTNAKLRVHVPLVVPRGCRMRVGDRMVYWKEGEPVVFDDSYEHEVWTTRGEPRCVLMFDIMHPELDREEATMMDRLDLFFAREYVMKLMRDGEGKTMPWLFRDTRKKSP